MSAVGLTARYGFECEWYVPNLTTLAIVFMLCYVIAIVVVVVVVVCTLYLRFLLIFLRADSFGHKGSCYRKCF